MQFTVGGHVVGFAPGSVLVAAGRHALRVEFAGAAGVPPSGEGAGAAGGGGSARLPVRYEGLWEGVGLAYDAAPGGILRSTWTIDPGADPGRILLRYSVPVALDAEGGLRALLAQGWMRESAPVAWQEAGGRRVPVAVAFRSVSAHEVGFTLGAYDRARTLWIDPTLTWNTYLGSSGSDKGYGVAVDGGGNVYVTGSSAAAWGNPVRPFTAGTGSDAFVAKLDPSGELLWNTFLGSSSYDRGHGIAVDGSGNVYVTGRSAATWGSPLRQDGEAFVAKLDASGTLLWNTFLGAFWGWGSAVAVDGSGNSYVTGHAPGTWGDPLRGGGGAESEFVAKLDASGALRWNTFVGPSDANNPDGGGIAVDADGHVYVTGTSRYSWGNPLRPFTPMNVCCRDAFVAKLDHAGTLMWNTFLGAVDDDNGGAVAVDGDGNAYVSGTSLSTWGNPVQDITDYPASDAFVAKLDTAGALVWNTFFGSMGTDKGTGIAVDGSGKAYLAWGYGGLAKFDTTGALQWNSPFVDVPAGVAADGSGNAYVTGSSSGDAFVAKYRVAPVVAIGAPLADAVLGELLAIEGTASPVSPSVGMTRVEVKVRDNRSGMYLRLAPTAWAPGEHWLGANGTSAWHLDTAAVSWTSGTRYTITARVHTVDGDFATATTDFLYFPRSPAYTQVSMLLSSQSILQTEAIEVAGALSEFATESIDLSGLRILLHVTPPPPGAVMTHETSTYGADGSFLFDDVVGFTEKGTYSLQAEFPGKPGFLQSAFSGVETLLVGNTAGYAVIVEGMVPDDPEGLASHHKTTRRVYETLLARDFDASNIFYFHHAAGEPGIVPPWGSSDVQKALAQAMTKMNGVAGPLWVILVDHGSPGKFHLGSDWIPPEALDSWLGTLEAGLDDAAKREKRIVVVGSCYSGSFIEALKRGPLLDAGGNLVDAGRLIVASAAADEESYKGPHDPDDGKRSGEFFVEELFKELRGGTTLKTAFSRATERTEAYTAQGAGVANAEGVFGDRAVQHPLLEDDGEWAGSNALLEGEGDGTEAARIRLGVGPANSAANPAELVRVTESQHLDGATVQALLWAEEDAQGAADAAWVEIKRPDTVLAARGGTGQLEWGTKRFFLRREGGRLERIYGADCVNDGCFDTPGRYDVYYFSRNGRTKEVSGMKHSAVFKDKAGNRPPGTVGLEIPFDGAETSTAVLLAWQDAVDPDGDPVTYTVRIWKVEAGGAATLVHRQEGLTESEAMIGREVGLEDGQSYRWQVVPSDPYGAEPAAGNQVWGFTPRDATNPELPGYLKGCVTNAVSGAAVRSPTVSGAVVFANGCYRIFGPAGSRTITASAQGYNGATVAATIVAGKSTTRDIRLVPHQFDLALRAAGTGTGALSGGGRYYGWTVHRVSALPHSGSVFSGWSGDCTGTANVVSVLVDRDRTCTATFTLIPVGNRAPVLDPVGSRRVNETRTLSFRLTAADPDGDVLTFSAAGMPAGASLDQSGAVFRWTPAHNQAGTYRVTFRVSDGWLTDSETVTITVLNQVLFYDDFAHGTAAGDPDWRVVLGSWGVTGAGKAYASSALEPVNVALARRVAGTYAAGVVSFKALLVRPARGTANAALLFSYRGTSLFRYVQLLPGKVVIGQAGTLGGQTARRRGFATALLQPGRWLRVRVALAADGTVTVTVGTRVVAAYKFQRSVPGSVGVRATAVTSLFDNCAVQGRLALP